MDTKKPQEPLDLRSEEVQEVMGRVPRRIGVWNVGVAAVVLVLFAVWGSLLHAPERTAVPVTVTAYPEPVAVTAPATGVLSVGLMCNGSYVTDGSPVARIVRGRDTLVLKAPATGTLEAERWFAGRAVRAGDTLFRIVPEHVGTLEAERWFAGRAVRAGDTLFRIVPEHVAPPVCFGRFTAEQAATARPGQTVRLRFAAYPEADYGFVEGRIACVSPLPGAGGGYYFEVSLPPALTTSTGRRIPFAYGLTAEAELVGQGQPWLRRLVHLPAP